MSLDKRIVELAREFLPIAQSLLRETIRVPEDYVDRPESDGGDPSCGLSNHEHPRLELLRRRIVELGAVDGARDVGYDAFGNLGWVVADRTDGIPLEHKTVVFLDGHTDTVKALRGRWREQLGDGIDAYRGLTDPARVDFDRWQREVGFLPPPQHRANLIAGRGSADQLGGVVCQVIATKIARELRAEGALRGVIIKSFATVAEEDNDGGGPMAMVQDFLAGDHPSAVPDVVILTEGTGHAKDGAVGIYRGQRGRMQIEVEVTGRSCHGSMPSEGRNPLELGAAILSEATAQAAQDGAFADDAFLGPGTRTASWAVLDTPSDCAVPERFTFRFDRRLTIGETPEGALEQIASLRAVQAGRDAGFEVRVSVPSYDQPTWTGAIPGNPQIYPGWSTPDDHPAIASAQATYRSVCTPQVDADEPLGGLKRQSRLSRWIFSTDGVGYPIRLERARAAIPASKRWVESGAFAHPAMFGVGPGIEHNTHKIGECVDSREMALVCAFLARFPSLYREHLTAGGKLP